MADPTPRTLHRAAAAEFGESWRSPGVQRYLGSEFGSPVAALQRDHGPSAEARLQSALAVAKEARAASSLGAHASHATDGSAGSLGGAIGAYRAGGPAPTAPAAPAASDLPAPGMGDALAADYRAQLQRYAQQLAAKDGEAAAMRAHTTELRQQLAAAEGRAARADEAAARRDAAATQLEAQAAALERQLAEREAELAAAATARRAAEQAAAAARATAAAAQKAAGGRAGQWEADRRNLQEQLERRDKELHSLEDALRQQAAVLNKRSREWAEREQELGATHTRSHGATAAARAELAAAQERLDAAVKRARLLEADNAELRRQKAQARCCLLAWWGAQADQRMLEELLADGDAERRELHDKYVRLGERLEGLVKEGKVLRSSASAESGAARTAVQAALKDADSAVKERAALAARVRDLQAKLEEEVGGRAALKDKVQRKLAAAEQEVAALRGELEGKARALQGLQADMKALQADAESRLGACESQLLACKERASGLASELDAERARAAKARADAEAAAEERLRLELAQQALKYERRVQELEVAGCGPGLLAAGCTSPARGPGGGGVLDYIPRAEHARILDARLAAKEADAAAQLSTRLAQAEREWQWKLEAREQEAASLGARVRQLEADLAAERQRAASHANTQGEEARRLQAQCIELQRQLEVHGREAAKMKEALKDARCANADMDDDALSAGRAAARLRHALEESQGALREAQGALAQERKRCEEAQREAEAQAALASEAARRGDRLAGEASELAAALEQKQELVAALQAESDSWSAKLMAHREFHEGEVEALRRGLREEGEARVAQLEAQCGAQAAALREARREHEEALAALAQQHAAQVSQLEAQLAASERGAGELRELTARLGSVRHEDVEALKGAVQELQLRLREAVRERERGARAHAAQLAALGGQVRAKLAALRAGAGCQASPACLPLGSPELDGAAAQQGSDVAAACAECLACYETALAGAQQRLERQASAAEAQQAELGAQAGRFKAALQQLLAALAAEGPGLQAAAGAAQEALLEGGASDSTSGTGAPSEKQAKAAAQQVARAVQAHVEQAEAAAIHSALSALEAELLPAGQRAEAGPQRRLLSPSKRLEASTAAAVAAGPGAGQPAAAVPSLEANEGRLAALLDRSRELVSQLAASQAEVAGLRQQVAVAEAQAASLADRFQAAQAEGLHAAEAARAAAVAPLQAEVLRLTERVIELQQRHAAEVAAARQQAGAAQGEAQAALDRMSAGGRELERALRAEEGRSAELASDLARAQGELAAHSSRAAAAIEVQQKELELLRGRIRELEARDAALRQRGGS